MKNILTLKSAHSEQIFYDLFLFDVTEINVENEAKWRHVWLREQKKLFLL